METLSAAEHQALEAQLSLGQPQIWKNSFGYDAGRWRVERHPRLLADVNGDSRDDVVGFGNGGVWVAISDGSTLGRSELWVNDYGYEAGGWRVERHPRLLADVDGDGRADVVGFGDSGVYVSLSTGTAFQPPSLWLRNYGYTAGNWRVDRHPRFVADVDGDYRADIVGFGDDGVYVSLSTGSGFTSPALWVGNYGYVAGGWRVNLHPRLLADANGDGKLDVVGFGIEGTYVSLAGRNSFGEARLWVNNYGYGAGGWRAAHPRFATDVNADGRADIVGFGERGAYVSLSNGRSFASPRLWVEHYGTTEGWRVESHPRFVRDIDADGRADIVGFGNAGVYVSYSNDTSFSEPVLAVDGFGYERGGWRVEKHPRLLGLMNRDRNVDIVGFGNDGVYVSTSVD